MLRSLPENSQFHPNILDQQALTNHKIESYCVTSVNQRDLSEFKTHLLEIGFSILILFCFKEKHATPSRRNLRKLRRSYFLKYVLLK